MTTDVEKSHPGLEEENKATSVVAYTESSLILGEVITKQTIRVSTWLRTQAMPQFLLFRNVSLLRLGSGSERKPMTFGILYLPSSQVLAFHIKPPASDPLDYDTAEPMRKMEPVSALVGWFRFDGFIRMSTHTDLEKYLDVSKDIFTTLYEVDITQPLGTSSGVLHVPMTLVRTISTAFSPRSV